MKLIPVIVFLVVLVASSGVRCEPQGHSQAESENFPEYAQRPTASRVNPLSGINFNWNSISSLSDIISKFVPDAGEIFSASMSGLLGTPARVVSFYVDKVCNVASTFGVLQQNYSPDLSDAKLQLYTASNVVSAPLNEPSALVESSEFNPDYNVTIFVTGWRSVVGDAFGYNPVGVMKSAYNQRGGHNFIVFDAGYFVNTLYRWATLDILHFGSALGNALISLNSQIPASRIHLIGHGVGAHIVGVAAQRFEKSTRQVVPRITALDPASPCVGRGIGLTSQDAEYVQVIHSNNGVLGKREASGDIDFYPNGPVPLQPGCVDVMCAHYRSVEYYAESVRSGSEDNFMAVKCNSIHEYNTNQCHGQQIPMGYATPASAKGSYYLQTNSASPFGKNSSYRI